jgi:4-amino-4-deoxy-L-arabinose transferase-like glycosyltransferase
VPNKYRDFKLLMLLVALSLLVRTAFFLIYAPDYRYEALKVDGWLQIAQNLVKGGGYSYPSPGIPTAQRGPAVVFFFAAILWVFGQYSLPIIIAQWIADAGTCVLLYLLALEVFNDRRVAFVSSLLFGLYVPEMTFTWRALSEPLFTFLLAAFTLLLLRTLRSPSAWRFALTGALLALTILARPFMQFYTLAVFVLIFWKLRKDWYEAVKGLGIFSITLLLVLAPWIIRNYMAFGHFISGNTHSGLTFFQGNYALGEPDFLRYRDWEESDEVLRKELGMDPASESGIFRLAASKGMSEYQVDQMARAEAVQAILAHPDRYLVLSLMRFFRLWFNIGYGAPPTLQSYMVLAVNGALLSLALMAFLFYRGSWLKQAVPVATLIAFNTALHMAVLAIFRYHIPVMPCVALFAGFTLVKAKAYEKIISHFPVRVASYIPL